MILCWKYQLSSILYSLPSFQEIDDISRCWPGNRNLVQSTYSDNISKTSSPFSSCIITWPGGWLKRDWRGRREQCQCQPLLSPRLHGAPDYCTTPPHLHTSTPHHSVPLTGLQQGVIITNYSKISSFVCQLFTNKTPACCVTTKIWEISCKVDIWVFMEN